MPAVVKAAGVDMSCLLSRASNWPSVLILTFLAAGPTRRARGGARPPASNYHGALTTYLPGRFYLAEQAFSLIWIM